MIGAHVISYEKHVGPVPPGMEVCHQCDNPPCTNPKHLFLGTHAENHADKAKKGRSNRWEKNPMAKMTKDLVVKVRKLKDETGRSSRSIALDFGVSETTIRNIVNGKSWAGL
jgi:ribosome-binding protein aMBF1 (putative translation factor)